MREKGLWARTLHALDDARSSGEIQLRVGVQIDVRCCDQMLHDATGCRYNGDEVLASTAAVATEPALRSQSEAQRELAWAC